MTTPLKPYYEHRGITIYHSDCREVLPLLEAESVTAVVTDPPYGLEFMGKDWDHGVPGREFWQLIAAVCKPGAHLLAFGGTRTAHRLMCAIEDAGWEIRDTLMWLYGSGFPKSLNIGKAIDKAAGAEREVVGQRKKLESYGPNEVFGSGPDHGGIQNITAPATEAAKLFDGYGSSLKPAFEPICLAMKPLDGTYAQNAIEHGVAGLNINGSRIGTESTVVQRKGASAELGYHGGGGQPSATGSTSGRWPANLILDEEAGAMLDEQSGERPGCKSPSTAKPESKFRPSQGGYMPQGPIYPDQGGASRFFYCAKASKADRGYTPEQSLPLFGETWPEFRNTHATVKPIALMEYLCKLVMPPANGLILDPFAGSGTTGVACKRLGIRAVLIEENESYCEIAAERLRNEH